MRGSCSMEQILPIYMQFVSRTLTGESVGLMEQPMEKVDVHKQLIYCELQTLARMLWHALVPNKSVSYGLGLLLLPCICYSCSH